MERLIVIDRQTGLMCLDVCRPISTTVTASAAALVLTMDATPDTAVLVTGLWPSWDRPGFDVFALAADYQHRAGSLEAQTEAVCALARPVLAVSW